MGHFLACLRPSDRRLLEFLLRKAESGTSIRVEDINHHMGLGSKPEELQKVSRNKAIQNINEAFHSALQSEEELIGRIRDSNDRRLMMYQIHPHYVSILIKLIDA